MQLSNHFSLAEFTRSASYPHIPNQPGEAELAALQALCTEVLDPLRVAIGAPVRVSSGYRGPELNRRVGGARRSQHLSGQAADLQSASATALKLFKTLIERGLPFDQAIYEDKSARSKWLHVSHNIAGNRGQLLVASFTGGRARYALVTPEQALAMVDTERRYRGQTDLPFEELDDEPPEHFLDASAGAGSGAEASASSSASREALSEHAIAAVAKWRRG
jgi:hypothetical protein